MTATASASIPRSSAPLPSLLEVRELDVAFFLSNGAVQVLYGVNFSVGAAEILGIVGESGSGKSVTALSIMRLLRRPGRVTGGSLRFEHRNLLELSSDEMRSVRGNEISMIFQSP